MAETAIVTGGAGFIGSHVADALLEGGVSVVVVDDLTSGERARVNPEAEFVELSIVEKSELESLFDRVRPSAVYHLGAQSSVTVSTKDPNRDGTVNVLGTLNVLEAAKRFEAPTVFTSTGGALYGNEAPIPTSEDRLPAPLAPYGASKWAGEAYLQTWAHATGIPNAVCRLGNVYGPRQSPHGEAGVVSIFSHRLWKGERPLLFGHGRPTRDYIHVQDVVSAMLAASGTQGVFNVATGRETDVFTLLELLQRAAGTELEPELAELRPGELERSCMDPSRAARELGWTAAITIEQGIPETYASLVEGFETGASR
jgi:UDP-glucose 4-epimerase